MTVKDLDKLMCISKFAMASSKFLAPLGNLVCLKKSYSIIKIPKKARCIGYKHNQQIINREEVNKNAEL